MIRVVKPGGTLLASAAGLLPLIPDGGDYWRLSPDGWRFVLEAEWAGCEVSVEAHGNCLAAVAAMYGLAQEELSPNELDAHDPRYPMLTTIRCRKPARLVSRPMKIVQAVGWYHPDSLGGTEIYVAALARHFRACGHQVLVAAPEAGAPAPRTYEFDGCQVFRYPVPATPTRDEAQGETAARGSEHLPPLAARRAAPTSSISTRS